MVTDTPATNNTSPATTGSPTPKAAIKPAYGSAPTLKNFKPTPAAETETVKIEVTTNAPADVKVSFETAWGEYIAVVKSSAKHGLLAYFEKNTPAFINENTFVLKAPHKVSANILEDERQDMLVLLRRRTGNVQLNMQIDIEQADNEVMPYTNKEKFESLAQKNPKLMEFKNLLDLEIE